MRKLILVAVVLQLAVIIIGSDGYNFGDIISFNREGVYKHFAIYVGDEPIKGVTREAGQDIFHFTTPKGGKERKCIFGVLKETGKATEANDLDGKALGNGEIIRKGLPQEIKDRIKTMMNPDQCKKYSVLSNNCEHLATFVRYGYRVTNQKGTLAWIFVRTNKPEQDIELNEAVRKIVIERMNCRRHSV